MASTKPRRLEKGELVLVTGANGYVGSQVIDVLLEEGLNVRGTLRNDKPWLHELFEKKHGKGRFETVIVPSMEDEAAVESAMKGVSGVVHVAAAVEFSPIPEQVIPVVIDGTLKVMRAAAKHSSIKSVVLTSSSSAAMIAEPDKHAVITENSWNDAFVQAAWSEQVPQDMKPLVVYAASKTEGERKAWEWYRENKPHYAFNSVLPNFNTGEILHPEIPGSTMGWIRTLLDGDKTWLPILKPQWYIDVKDDARVHVAALLDPSVESERLFAYAHTFTLTEIIGILNKLQPQNDKIVLAPESEGKDITEVPPSKRAEQLIKDFFGVSGWTSLEDSIAAGIAK